MTARSLPSREYICEISVQSKHGKEVEKVAYSSADVTASGTHGRGFDNIQHPFAAVKFVAAEGITMSIQRNTFDER